MKTFRIYYKYLGSVVVTAPSREAAEEEFYTFGGTRYKIVEEDLIDADVISIKEIIESERK